MKWRQTAKERRCARRTARRVAILTVLVVATSSPFSRVGTDSSVAADAALAPAAAHGHALLKPPSERTGAWADGAIDSFEEDDLSCEHRVSAPSERTGSGAPLRSRTPRFGSGELARSCPARGPPSA